VITRLRPGQFDELNEGRKYRVAFFRGKNKRRVVEGREASSDWFKVVVVGCLERDREWRKKQEKPRGTKERSDWGAEQEGKNKTRTLFFVVLQET